MKALVDILTAMNYMTLQEASKVLDHLISVVDEEELEQIELRIEIKRRLNICK